MKTFMTIATAAFLALSLQAQGPGQGQRPEPTFTALQEALKLSDAQLTQLRTLNTQTLTSLESTFADIRTKRQALRTALNANPVDAAAVTRLRAELAELHKKVETARTNARVSAVGLLTSDQKATLAQLEQALKLMPAAGQATRLNLLAPPERDGEGFPGGGRGLNGHRGMPLGSPMMFR